MRAGKSVLERLEDWYESMCNGDWEHTYGVFISNVDNPGWSLKVELTDTYLYEVPFSERKIERENPNDWIICRLEDGEFIGYGGPRNLTELLQTFLDWAEENAP